MLRTVRQTVVIGAAAALVLLGSVLAARAADETKAYQPDPAHSSVGFAVKHMLINTVRGTFGEYTASIEVADGKLVAATADIDVTSIDTGIEKRDEHLLSADFFNAEEFPKLTFVSTGVASEGGKSVLKGNLTIRGTTKPVELAYTLAGPITDPWGKERYGLEVTGVIDRQEFGLSWSKALETGGLVVDNEVKLVIEMEFVGQ